MNSMIWIFLWILAAVPLGKFAVALFSKHRVEFGFAAVKVILTFIIAAILLFMTANDIVMWWIWLFWVIPWTIYELISGTEDDPAILGIVAMIAFVLFIISGASVAFVSGNNNAIYFDNFIVKSEGFPIKNEVPDNMLRLATQDLAESVVSQHMGEFGSSVERINSHIVVADGRLKWVSMIAKQESWGLTYRSDGMIAVDAVDPDLPVQPMHAKFTVAEGLDFNPLFGAMGNSNVKGYFDIDTGLVYGDTYPVFNPDTKEWNLAMTTYRPDMFSVRKYSGVYILNQRGEVIDHYASDAPSWVIKPFDEHGFLEPGIKDWGSHRRGDGFDLFAGGFLNTPPSNDRLEMTEDTRYVYNPDNGEIVAMIMVHSTRTNGENSLAGVFVADSDKITYYDLSKLDLMSGVAAGAIVKGKLTAGAGTTYETAMELLYPIKIGNQTRYCYFVPIYAHTTGKSIITFPAWA
jgi:hypothetical protein